MKKILEKGTANTQHLGGRHRKTTPRQDSLRARVYENSKNPLKEKSLLTDSYRMLYVIQFHYNCIDNRKLFLIAKNIQNNLHGNIQAV